MAAIIEAFDRHIYQRLIPQHLLIKDLASIPESILEQLVNGGFSAWLSSSEWHAVALDECHETKINKDAKLAILRPTESKMLHTSNYLQFRADCLNNLKNELFAPQNDAKPKFSHAKTSKEKVEDGNVRAMLGGIKAHGMFSSDEENCGLYNIFTGELATPEQTHDMLHYRDIGQLGFEAYISSKILRQPSTQAPMRKKRLCTFTTGHKEKRRVKQVDRERKLTQRFLKCHLSRLLTNPRQCSLDPEMLCGPISPVPQAITDSNGLPYKGIKSTVTS